MFLEFLQHHLLLGVSHIFLTMPFVWDGKFLPKYLRILRSFIEEGTVSITSHADSELEHIYNVKKMAIHRDTVKTFQVRSMLYVCCVMIVCILAFRKLHSIVKGGIYSLQLRRLLSTISTSKA